MQMIINYAHRGASGYCPENTMASFIKAIELGATGIETDVQMTSDGQLVLIHDENLLRTTGIDKYVKDVTLAEIKQLDAGSWFNESFSAEKIPTLDELMQLAKQSNIKLNIEIKSGVFIYHGIEQKVIDKIYEFELQHDVIISNFNHYSLALCKQIDPAITTGILYMEGLYQPWDYAATLLADALHAPRYAVLPEWVEAAKQNGKIYNVWTVNNEQEMKNFVAAGVAGIITNYPDRLHQILQGKD
ncbi:glycerophosphodiester phosphodiesterase [Paenibacillus endoradicis]|uniref:glycerophosphodiester phosphodiesterase n=1 Tax=Paenibacillus endoradicis TaxID=2972487 RepID=UPI00215954C4|nr:glycerophosphodiester phosphodiesterase [Paenibacillus endoradicis]MCR8657045.1 glycerophosphodiester phosphodiesterase [Paenibacillus endoradicis]